MDNMIERLESIEKRYNELTQVLMDPEIGSDIKRMTEASKEQASLQAAYDLYQEYKGIEEEIAGNKEMLEETDDQDMIEMIKMELDELQDAYLIERVDIFREHLKALNYNIEFFHAWNEVSANSYTEYTKKSQFI